MSTGLQTSAHDWQNFYVGHLTADITNVATDIFIDTIPVPTESCLVIDPDTPANTEVIFYTSKTATKVTTPGNGRGYDGSTAVAHLSGTKVILAPIGDDFRYIRTLATAMATYIGAGGGFDFVASGAVITPDAAGSTLLASMTSGTCYIAGAPVVIPVSTARAYTANSDTYVDVNSSGVLAFTVVANNAASPALAASSIRLGIVVTGATNIAATTSINQGQESRVLPIASSIAYSVTDSLGNLICPRDPNRKILGYRQVTANIAGVVATTATVAPGLSAPVIVPTGRKVKITIGAQAMLNNTAGASINYAIYEGASEISTSGITAPGNNYATIANREALTSPSAGLHTYQADFFVGSGSATLIATATSPAFIRVELA